MSLSDWFNAKDWWKSPVLQGPENDYGDYDYLIELIPSNNERWERYHHKCDYCGKYHKLNRVFTGYFRTMDGYDSITDTECWKCCLKDLISSKIRKVKRKIHNKIEEVKFMREYKRGLKERNSAKLTKEVKKAIHESYKNRGNY